MLEKERIGSASLQVDADPRSSWYLFRSENKLQMSAILGSGACGSQVNSYFLAPFIRYDLLLGKAAVDIVAGGASQLITKSRSE